MLRLITTIVLCAGFLCAQTPQYITGADTDVATTARNLVIRQTASPTRVVLLHGASIYCEADCVVTITRNASISGGTAETVQGINPGSTRTATATAVRQATATGGTSFESDVIAAGSTAYISLEGHMLYDSTDNLVVAVASVSDRVVLKIASSEEAR